MEIEVNYQKWKLLLKDTKTLVDKYNSENEVPCTFAFGVTLFPIHEIWINRDMCIDQQINTLKHELTHCYIFTHGLYNVPNYNEEMVCDLVTSINDFINNIICEFRKVLKREEV